MKISVIKPTKIVASIECKYDSYGFYNLYLIMDGEIVDQHRWLLRDREYNCDANIMSTILCAFGLSSKQYSLLHPTWMSVEVLTRRCDDFTLNVFEESIVK